MQTKDYGANHSKECKTVSSHVNVQYVSLWSCFLIWLSRIWYVALFSAKMAYVSYKLFLIKHNACIREARCVNNVMFMFHPPRYTLAHILDVIDMKSRMSNFGWQ